MSLRFSIIIVSLNGRPRIAMPLDALRRCDPAPFEVIVVDNGSTDGLSEFVREHYPEVVLVRAPRNLGFAGGNNLGLVNATGDVPLLLNDDTEPHAGWLGPLAVELENSPRLGVVGCRLVYPDTGRIQHLGGIVHANGLTDHVAWGEDWEVGKAPPLLLCDYATGAAMAIRREVISQIGMLDAGFFPIYYEELDFCERARRAGWLCGVATESVVVHHESQTTGRLSPRFLRTYHRNRIRYLLRNRRPMEWPGVLRAEARWMAQHRPWDNLWPCALAYAWAPLHAMDLLRSGRR